MAMESRKHAAKRPSPPLPRPASGSCSSSSSRVNLLLLRRFPDDRVEQEIGDVIGERAPDQVLHREIVDALGVLPRVVFFGADPALRQEVAHRAGQRLEPFARPGGSQRHDIVEDQVPLIESIGRTRELDRATAVLLQEFA